MALIDSDHCIDIYEGSLTYTDHNGTNIWPFNKVLSNNIKYTAIPAFQLKPQAYISALQAKTACVNAGKQLCNLDTWLRACRGPLNYTYPYGNTYQSGNCNEGRPTNPVIDLFGKNASFNNVEMNDPRLDLLPRTVAMGGDFTKCMSYEGAFDMHGNLHEWIDYKQANGNGMFKGGFFVDAKINGPGCLYTTKAHAQSYHDYSTGFRCCSKPQKSLSNLMDPESKKMILKTLEPKKTKQCSCPGDMGVVPFKQGICMDIYEAPNIIGSNPLVMYNLNESQKWCETRGKRLCYEDEWTLACTGGKFNYSFPYGPTAIPGYCNDDKTWKQYNQSILNYWKFGYASADIESFDQLMREVRSRNTNEANILANHLVLLYQGTKAGQTKKCFSMFQIADTIGNVEEWTLRRDGENLFHGNLKGRYWAERRTCQSNVKTHGDAFRFYEIGFRCCKDLCL